MGIRTHQKKTKDDVPQDAPARHGDAGCLRRDGSAGGRCWFSACCGWRAAEGRNPFLAILLAMVRHVAMDVGHVAMVRLLVSTCASRSTSRLVAEFEFSCVAQ